MRIDIHQHFWTEPLLESLARRRELPFIRSEHGLTALYLAGERPFVLDLTGESPRERARLVQRDGIERALVCISSPLGIESLPREECLPLLDAYHEGALALGEPFGVWGAVPLDRPDPRDVDRALDRGCVGISLPAGALAGVSSFARLRPLLSRLESRDAPLLVHPGPGANPPGADAAALGDPLWWPALTRYVSAIHTAWFAFFAVGRSAHPRLKVAFTMLAGLAPLQGERLAARGGHLPPEPDPLVFYDVSSYGASAVRAIAATVGRDRLLYGSDRPVVDPSPRWAPDSLGFDLHASGAEAAARLLDRGGGSRYSLASRARVPGRPIAPRLPRPAQTESALAALAPPSKSRPRRDRGVLAR